MAIETSTEAAKREDCSACRGSGTRESDYTRPRRTCYECFGTGLVLSGHDNQLVEGVIRAVRLRMDYGWER